MFDLDALWGRLLYPVGVGDRIGQLCASREGALGGERLNNLRYPSPRFAQDREQYLLGIRRRVVKTDIPSV